MSDFWFGFGLGMVFVALCMILADDMRAMVRREVTKALAVPAQEGETA
jgi:hypothetical protein